MRRVLVILAVVGLCWPVAALAQDTTPRDPRPQVVLSGDVDVPRGSTVGEVVVLRGSASVDGVVDGDVIVVRGPVTVSGQVRGDVVALSGTVRLRATAQVGGSVLAGDTVEAEAGAQVAGGVTQGIRYTLGPTLDVLGALLVPVVMAVSILLLGLLWLLLAPRTLDPVAVAGREAAAASIGWGILVAVLVPVLAVAFSASVLALPLGLAILLGTSLVGMVGLAAATWFVGRLAVRTPRSRTGAWFAGWGIAAAVGLVPFLNVAWWVLGTLFGLGTIVVATWRARRAPVDGLVATGRRGKHRVGRAPAPGTLRDDASDLPPAGLG